MTSRLTTVKGALPTEKRMSTGNLVYPRVFDFWMKAFALSFAMAIRFGTDGSVLSERAGSIRGSLLGYEGFIAFLLEATFFGVVLLDRTPLADRWCWIDRGRGLVLASGPSHSIRMSA
jgi:cytochrome bd ubiquinol oxidase subunit I